MNKKKKAPWKKYQFVYGLELDEQCPRCHAKATDGEVVYIGQGEFVCWNCWQIYDWDGKSNDIKPVECAVEK